MDQKLDQILVVLNRWTEQSATHPAAEQPYMSKTPDDIPQELQLNTDFLQASRRKANNCGHFAAILVTKVFPELFGPMRLRLLYNWNGAKGKQPLDEQRKKVLRTYVNMYYPETRLESSWATCFAKVNEVLRRKYVPKAQQLQEIAGELTDLPSYAEEMINNSLNDIVTPNFGEGFSTYREYLHGQFE